MAMKMGELESVKALKAFHEDEDGMETLQVVMLVALAAVVLIVVKIFWNEIRDWVRGLWDKTKDTSKEEKFR